MQEQSNWSANMLSLRIFELLLARSEKTVKKGEKNRRFFNRK